LGLIHSRIHGSLISPPLSHLVLCAEERMSSFPRNISRQPTNLRVLNLKGNRLTELSFLRNLSSLTDLMLSGNQLSSITDNLFRRLTALENLDLSDNQLTSLPEGIFKNLLSIKVINLHNNNLTEVDAKLFEDQIFVERLYLSDNKLETLPLGLLDHFITQHIVRLHGNPWRCDCQLWYLHDWLLDNGQNVEMLDMMACESPYFLRKRTVVSIPRDHLGAEALLQERPWLKSCPVVFSAWSLRSLSVQEWVLSRYSSWLIGLSKSPLGLCAWLFVLCVSVLPCGGLALCPVCTWSFPQ
uniref:LRRCT domain-containing protein n=1 Tax=Fundulus heteroclitus TaxID=8078 RepID=A0A3Q2PQ72_FUNHE